MPIKSENQVYTDLISIADLKAWFPNSTFSEWQVLQLNQPVKLTEIKPTIWISATTRNRRGWQYREYDGFGAQQTFKQTQKFKQEITVQFSALRNRLITDDVSILNSTDILVYLKTYLLKPETLQYLKTFGYSIYQPTEIQNPTIQNDSDDFEFMPFFSVTFIYEQSLERPQDVIDEYTIKTIEGV